MPAAKLPLTEKRLAANRANAAKSTGPITPEGKTRSAQNSRKHGFTASTFAVVRLEELDETANLRQDLIDFYHPANSQELFAVERIALAQHALLRASRLEVGLFTSALNETIRPTDGARIDVLAPSVVGDIEVTRAQNRNFAIGEGFHRMTQKSNAWALFLRYQAQAERNYRRALEDLDRLLRLRQDHSQPPNPADPVGQDEILRRVANPPSAPAAEPSCPKTPSRPAEAAIPNKPTAPDSPSTRRGRNPASNPRPFDTPSPVLYTP